MIKAPLLIDVSVGDTLDLTLPPGSESQEPQQVRITVEKKSGQVARLRIRAPGDVTIKLPSRRAVPQPT